MNVEEGRKIRSRDWTLASYLLHITGEACNLSAALSRGSRVRYRRRVSPGVRKPKGRDGVEKTESEPVAIGHSYSFLGLGLLQ